MIQRRAPALHGWGLLALLLAIAHVGGALAAEMPAGVSISPVRLDLDRSQFAAAVTVRNAGGTEKIMQVSPALWQQQGDEEHYQPSSELVVNPPLFRLHAGGVQVVRIGLARNGLADAVREKSFRVYFEELPVAAAEVPGTQLRLLLRIGIPVFIKPLQAAKADLQWQTTRLQGGQLALTVHNQGLLHERVASLAVHRGDASVALATIEGFAYLLPGASHQWTLPVASDASNLQLSAVTEGGPIRVALPLLAH